MPKSIHVWIGLEIQDVFFTQGRSEKFDPRENGFALGDNQDEYREQKRKEIWVPCGAYFYLPENSTHPRKLYKKLEEIISYASEDSDVNFTTHSKDSVIALAEMVSQGFVPNEIVYIHVMKDDNSEIDYTATIDKDGYLQNWRAGELYMDIN